MITDDFHTITLTKEQYNDLVTLRQMEENVKRVFKLLADEDIMLLSEGMDIFKLPVKSIDVSYIQEETRIYFKY